MPFVIMPETAAGQLGANHGGFKDTPFVLATGGTSDAIIDYLTDLITKTPESYERRINYACEHGELDEVKRLCERSDRIITAESIAYAGMSGRLNVVKYLHKYDVDVVQRNVAIRLAHINGHPKTVKYLLKQGADITVWNR